MTNMERLEDSVKAMPKMIGLLAGGREFVPDYTFDSLARIEQIINEVWPDGKPVLHPTTYLPFGFYFGELLRRNFRGEWDITDPDGDADGGKNLWDYKIKFAADTVIYPFRRVKAFWHDRHSSMMAMYKTLEVQQSPETFREALRRAKPIPKEEENDGQEGWYLLQNGVAIRMVMQDNGPCQVCGKDDLLLMGSCAACRDKVEIEDIGNDIKICSAGGKQWITKMQYGDVDKMNDFIDQSLTNKKANHDHDKN